MAGHRVAHATLKGPSVVKEIIIGITLGLAAGSLWKMHHWNEQRKVRAFYDLLEKGEISVSHHCSSGTAKTQHKITMATIAGVSVSTPRILTKTPESPKVQTLKSPWLNHPWKRSNPRLSIRPVTAVPEGLSEKVADSIKNAKEVCSDDPVSGECVAAWDVVEELSAATSHARARNKESDSLENYCKDNPETAECRTYDN
ncbi:unnamed protein product [Ilex paraguariensis]|uniref:CP12 domain-containing protein n=1 Tax=Ilex paraguariensis TaxID=185542 RepID=A0ABC8RJQ5_9AQUA